MKRFLLGCALLVLCLPTLACALVLLVECRIARALWPEKMNQRKE